MKCEMCPSEEVVKHGLCKDCLWELRCEGNRRLNEGE